MKVVGDWIWESVKHNNSAIRALYSLQEDAAFMIETLKLIISDSRTIVRDNSNSDGQFPLSIFLFGVESRFSPVDVQSFQDL